MQGAPTVVKALSKQQHGRWSDGRANKKQETCHTCCVAETLPHAAVQLRKSRRCTAAGSGVTQLRH